MALQVAEEGGAGAAGTGVPGAVEVAAGYVEGDGHGLGETVPDRGAGDRQAGHELHAVEPEADDVVAGVAPRAATQADAVAAVVVPPAVLEVRSGQRGRAGHRRRARVRR